jgi:hypothetical protein
MKLTSISIEKFKVHSQSKINKLNDVSLNDGILNDFSKSISNYYGTCYNHEPSKLGIIYNLTKNENENLNIRKLTRSATNLTSKFDVDKCFKVKKQIEIKKAFDNLDEKKQQQTKSHDKITAQPSFKHYARHVLTREIKMENSYEKNSSLKISSQPQSRQNRDDFNKVIKLLLRVKPRKLSIKEIQKLNVSEKYQKEVSKLIFYPQFLAFSPVKFL